MQGLEPDPFVRVRHLVQSGALTEARRLVRRTLAAEPSSAAGLTLAGQIAIRAQAAAEAVKHFNWAVTAEQHEDPRALLNLARAQDIAGLSADALTTTLFTARRFPNDERPRGLLALIHLAGGRPDAAAAVLRQEDAARLDPDTAFKIGARLLAIPGHRALAVDLLRNTASRPGRYSATALHELLSALELSDPRAYDIARRHLILEPGSADGMDLLERALLLRRSPLKQAAWLWQSCCVRVGDKERLRRAAEATYKVKWPKHGIAAHDALLKRRPEDTLLVDRICELFRRHHELSEDKAEAQDDAVRWARSVIATDPRNPRIWDAIAGMLKNVEAFDEITALWPRIIAKFPTYEVLHYNYSLFLDERDRFDEAIRELHIALALKPDYQRAYNMLSMVMTHLHDVETAIRYVWWAILAGPKHPSCWANYGTYLRAVGRNTEALMAFQRAEREAVGKDKDLEAAGRFNSGMTLITHGELEAGFQQIEARWATRDFPSPRRRFKQPIWRGPRIHPRTGLVAYMEQGLGDEVMMSWYIPFLRNDTSKLIVDCDERLVNIMSRTYEGVEFVPRSIEGHEKTRDPKIRHKVPMLHVPQYYVPEVKELIRRNWDWAQRSGGRFPARLAVEPDRIDRWRQWLADRFPGRPSLGLSWRSKMHTRMRDQQYVTLDELAATLPTGAVAINLQYSSTDEETARLKELGVRHGFEFVTPEGVDLKDDLDDIFAILQVCDAAVTPMITLAWMAGAVGCPAYIFRASREGCIWQTFGTPFVPWAPSFRIFYRDPSEPWQSVIDDMRESLSAQLAVSSQARSG